MIPERDFVLAQAEVRRRQQEAAEDRLAREARRSARRAEALLAEHTGQPRGAFGWLRRLAGGTR